MTMATIGEKEVMVKKAMLVLEDVRSMKMRIGVVSAPDAVRMAGEIRL